MAMRAAALALALLAAPAAAHDGFEDLEQRGADCCGGHDCRTIPDGWIAHVPDAGGYQVTVPAGAWPEKFPVEYFPEGIVLQWEGEPGWSLDGRTIACAVASYGMMSYGGSEPVAITPSGRLRCLFVGGSS
jgi:hypothetical protein